MLRTKLVCLIGAGLLLLGVSLPAFAHERNHPNRVVVQAPLDAVNCTAVPPTISALGLTIDISQATFGGERDDDDDCTQTCADLTVGQTVRVKLAGDTPGAPGGPLTGTDVKTEGGRDDDDDDDVPPVKIAAPLQAVDPGGISVTVLGLVVNTAQAVIVGDDSQPITLDPRMVGQFARVKLASNQPPLTAAALKAHGVQVKVVAPIDSTACRATPPTISVLGLTIDISNASLGTRREHCDGDHGDGGDAADDHEGDDDDGDGSGAPLTCADLTVGQTVSVKLAGDVPGTPGGPLTGTEVKTEGGGGGGDEGDDDDDDDDHDEDVPDVKIAAPLQAVDPGGISVTVLGLTIGIGQAVLEDSNGQPITASQLVPGQFADLLLISNQAPLTAAAVQVQPPVSVLHVTLIDEKGAPVNDGPANSISADVTMKVGKQIMRFHASTNGSFNLAGLPKGQAKIVVTRVHNGQTSRARGSVKVKAQGTQNVRMRLRPVKR